MQSRLYYSPCLSLVTNYTSGAINGIIRYRIISIHSLFISCHLFLSRLFRRSLVISLLITAILSWPAGVQKPGHRYRKGDPGGKKGGAASHTGHRGSADQLLRTRFQGHGPTDRNRPILFFFFHVNRNDRRLFNVSAIIMRQWR